MKCWTRNAYLKEKVGGSLCSVLMKQSREVLNIKRTRTSCEESHTLLHEQGRGHISHITGRAVTKVGALFELSDTKHRVCVCVCEHEATDSHSAFPHVLEGRQEQQHVCLHQAELTATGLFGTGNIQGSV